MDSVFNNWKEALTALHTSIGQDLAEVRKCKAELERIKDEIIAGAAEGKFIRDENRIVLSAPEIVIGNVGKDGVLRNGSSTIIVRGNAVSLEAVNEGSVTTRAAKIRQIAEDPGIDGLEHVVPMNSQIVSMARNVSLHASDNEGTFFEAPLAGGCGVTIHSDANLSIDATVSNEMRAGHIKKVLDGLKSLKSDQQKRMSELETATKQLMNDMESVFEQSDKLGDCDESELRSNAVDLMNLNEKFKSLAMSLARTSTEYSTSMSQLADTEQRIKDVEAAQELNNAAKDSYKTDTTGSGMTLVSEHIALLSADGDGNIRTNDGAGIDMNGKAISISCSADGQLIPDSGLKVMAENVMFDTRTTKLDETMENGDIINNGSFNVLTKDFAVLAVDSELSNSEIKEKALVKDSSITFRAEKMKAETTDTEGKATGSIELNTKEMEIKAVDVDKDKRTDKEMAAGSTITMFAEKMLIGSRDKDKNKAKQFQIAGEKVAVLGKETTEIQQGDGKAIVQLDGGNLKVSGSATEIYGKTTLQADTEIKGELKAPKGTIQNLEASSSFKSSNISDGIAVPAAPASASLSAKLQEEENKKQE